MGHVLGAKKSNLYCLFRGAEADDATGRPCRFNPVNPCQTGLPGVAKGRYYTRASAYAACAGASSIFGRFLLAARGALAIKGQGLLPGLSESTRQPR
jgi:hypothetical protein